MDKYDHSVAVATDDRSVSKDDHYVIVSRYDRSVAKDPKKFKDFCSIPLPLSCPMYPGPPSSSPNDYYEIYL